MSQSHSQSVRVGLANLSQKLVARPRHLLKNVLRVYMALRGIVGQL